jgi:hypothetical protein
MKLLTRIWLAAGITAYAAAICGAAEQGPYIGYVYPAGGRQGTVFKVKARGQRLRNISDIYFSGKGVSASVTGYVGAGGLLNAVQQEELRRRINKLLAKRSPGQNKPVPDAEKPPEAALPDLPELRNLEQMTPAQLRKVYDKFLNFGKRPKPPIAEEVTLEVTIDPNAALGDREVRFRTPAGLTNPVVFQVGQIAEVCEPDKDEEPPAAPSVLQAPVVLNGQIMPGGVDRFTLNLKKNERLFIAAQARKLIPYLADAVPGWFQAVMAVYDSNGKELAFADDCGFDPDPAIIFQPPQDGEYTIAIRDAIYRGREDFVYRIAVAGEELIRPLFPSGTRGGVRICAPSAEWQPRLRYWDNLPEYNETEPNNTGKTAQHIALPHIANGCISSPEDKDVFRFSGRAGDVVAAEVYARRAGSPLDSLLRLIDTKGRVIAWNDDHKDLESGLLTHHADSRLSARLPADGDYFIQISDATRHGGEEFFYSLRIGAPKPDFALCLTPASLNVTAGGATVATVYAARKDGWDGDIELTLKDAPEGFVLGGACIPKGRQQVSITLTAPNRRFDQPIPLYLEGRAVIEGKTVARPVTPATSMMQAFAYYHLVPCEQLMAMVTRGGRISPSLDMPKGDRLRIPAGGSAQMSYTMKPPNSIQLELSNPPAGITLGKVSSTPKGIVLVINADNKHTGYADNLIIESFTEVEVKRPNGLVQKRRVFLGTLPALPFEIVHP